MTWVTHEHAKPATLLYRLLAVRFNHDYGGAVRRLEAIRAELAAIQRLRERGIDAIALAGGIGSWRADGLPTEPLNEGEKS